MSPIIKKAFLYPANIFEWFYSLNIFLKKSIKDVWQGPNYVYEKYLVFHSVTNSRTNDE